MIEGKLRRRKYHFATMMANEDIEATSGVPHAGFSGCF